MQTLCLRPPLSDLLEEGAAPPRDSLRHSFDAVLEDVTLDQVRAALVNDQVWVWQTLFEEIGSWNMAVTPWAAKQSGALVRHQSLEMPLTKVAGLGPPSTRATLAFALRGAGADAKDVPVELDVLCVTPDVPSGDAFFVQEYVCFKATPGETGVHLEKAIGVVWSGRCLIKAIVERMTRSESAVNGARVAKILQRLTREASGGADKR